MLSGKRKHFFIKRLESYKMQPFALQNATKKSLVYSIYFFTFALNRLLI
jgi:hypothetical protein